MRAVASPRVRYPLGRFAAALEKLLEQSGIDQKTLALWAEIKPQALSGYKKREALPGPEVIQRLVEAVGVAARVAGKTIDLSERTRQAIDTFNLTPQKIHKLGRRGLEEGDFPGIGPATADELLAWAGVIDADQIRRDLMDAAWMDYWDYQVRRTGQTADEVVRYLRRGARAR